MKYFACIGVVLSLACISAAEAPSNYQVYGGVRVDSDPTLLRKYDHALGRCQPEALGKRGSPDTNSLLYNAALRGCLYRHGFTDRGAYAYPATNIFDHFLSL